MKPIDCLDTDPRPALGGWAPGDYLCYCGTKECGKQFIGAKRCYRCADCAYAEAEFRKNEPVVEPWWTAISTEEAAARILRDYEAGKSINANDGWVVRLASALVSKNKE